MAKYCAANICDVVKGTEAYQKGDLSLGLKQTFLRMDELLRSPAGQVRRLVFIVLCSRTVVPRTYVRR